MNLLYLDGIMKCAEFKVLIWPEALKSGINCNKQIRIADLPHFKIFNGTANNAVAVVEELVLEAIVSITVRRQRYATIREIFEYLKKMNKSSIYPVLRRLIRRKRIILQRQLVYYRNAPRRKYWNQDVYLPTMLQDRIKNEGEKIVIGKN